MNRKRVWAASALAAGAVLVAGACGGGGGNPQSPSPPGGGGTPATTITISSSGVSPRSITVPAGTRVTFVNNDNVPHEMNSDPHPSHGDCPEIDQVSFLAAGQSKLTGNLSAVRTCSYHDHNRPSDTNLQGSIRIQ